MAKINFFLDPRPRKDGSSALLLYFIHKRFRRKVNLGFDLITKQWCADKELVTNKHPQHKQINQRLKFMKATAESLFLKFAGDNPEPSSLFLKIEEAIFPEKAIQREAEETKQEAEETVKNTLVMVARRCTEMKKPSTRATYQRTLKHIEAFCAKGNTDNLDEINKAWLAAFENYLSETNPSPNARALHFRNLRSIINYAIDEEITTNYPFRRFKIKTVKTDKRSLSVETLRNIFNYEIEDWQVVYRDMFKLSFLLMGINFADLLKLTPGDLREGRIVFNRSKTGRLYSMKVEPEALELLRKYRGNKHLLSIMDSRTDYVQFIRQTNNALRKIGDCDRSGLGGKKTHHAICPDLSTYWARHTWATIAASLDIPKETIAAALGHGGNTVTDIYIDFDRKKVDEANRKVLDWVLYGIKDGKRGRRKRAV